MKGIEFKLNSLIASVIIPSYNRVDSLRRILGLLTQQTFPAICFEVILIDDGSTDSTPSIQQEVFPFRLKYYRQNNQGEHLARNLGAEKGEGRILIFLDDDIIVGRDYIATLIQTHERYDKVIALGNLFLYIDANSSLFRRISAGLEGREQDLKDDHIESFLECTSGVLSVKRDHYFSIGMMQLVSGSLRNRWGGLDFGYRAHKLGFKFIRCAGALAYHDDFDMKDLRAASYRWATVSKAAVPLFHKYPDLQRQIPMFRDKDPIAWQEDSSHLIARKLARHITSSRPSLRVMERIVSVLEQQYPSPALLRLLYRWIISCYIFCGYRQGLRDSSHA